MQQAGNRHWQELTGQQDTLPLNGKFKPTLGGPHSVVARTQSEFIRRGQARKHEGNEDSFDPRIGNKSLQWAWSCFKPLEGVLEPWNSQERDQPNLGGPQSKPSSQRGKKKSPLAPRAMTVHWLSPRFVKDGRVKTAGQPCFAECLPPSCCLPATRRSLNINHYKEQSLSCN